MHRENALKLPAPSPRWLTRRSGFLRTSSLTFGSLSVPGYEPPLRPTFVAARAPDPNEDPMQRENPGIEPRTGPLRNGNPQGNPNAAPRCGARTRRPAPAPGLDPGADPGGHPCRAPAMLNGRCRMHGGKSTGPRTREGLDRLRAANTRHGAYATSAARRARDPADPFYLHSVAEVVNGTRRLLALIRQAAPADPDPAALLALLRPEPLPMRRRPRVGPHAPPAPGLDPGVKNQLQTCALDRSAVSASATQDPQTKH